MNKNGTLEKCETCKIAHETPDMACCAWYMDNVVCGDKTTEDCTEYLPCDKEEEVSDRARCEGCIHSRVCVIRGFPSAFVNTHWEKEPCDHFKAADVAPRAEWISVRERLPDCEYGAETEALLFRLKTGTVEAGYFGTGGRFRDKYFRCYHHANEGWDAKDVTHWMPLPDPPKGDAS